MSQEYEVARYGHSYGHRPLVFGETVTARDLGAKESDHTFQVMVRRGVLRKKRQRAAPAKLDAKSTSKKDGER